MMAQIRIQPFVAGMVLLLGVWLVGCSSTKTETGYDPQRLGMSDAQRRGLYASPFSPEAKEAEAERASRIKGRGSPLGNFGQ